MSEPAGPPRVLIVGAGPAGLVAAITLARYGVSVQLVERRETTSTLSRAVVISTRTMEILRSWGLEEAVRAGAADVEPCAWLTHTLASSEGTVFPLGYPTAAEAAAVSPTRPAWAPQDHLEPLLLAFLRKLPAAEVCFGSELLELEQADGAVRSVLLDRGSGETRELETRFVLGSDGAHSTVRRLLGIPMEGPDALLEYHTVQFDAPLSGIAGANRYGLYVITHPDAAGVLVSRGKLDRWMLAREWTPGQPRFIDATEEELARLIVTAVGDPAVQPRIERTNAFPFAAQIAERYRDENAFLMGDAAHRMTPRGGTGMNTAILDAFDLGWKLAWVLSGWAGEDLLDTYETERRPVGLHNVERSGNPTGARQEAVEALPWDLNGRIPHCWFEGSDTGVSTLDLLGDGLALLAAPEEPRWATAGLNLRAPVVTHTVDAPTALSLGIASRGAMLVKPDGREVVRWSKLTTPLDGDGLPAYLRRPVDA